MIRPPLLSEIASRHGIKLANCDIELGQLRYCDAILVLDTNPAPYKEFFIRAKILQPDSEWIAFVYDYRSFFDIIFYGNNRLPTWTLDHLLKPKGLLVNIAEDRCSYPKGEK